MGAPKLTIQAEGAGEPTLRQVVSGDGTEIAYWTSGEGPPLVLVHGTSTDHTTWQALLPHLRPHATVHALDRRGRGASGDTPGYDLAREVDDVATVVDAIALSAGPAVDVLGHSFGGLCAFLAAARTSNVRRLVLYEGWPLPDPDASAPPELLDQLDRLLADGDREALLERFYRAVVMMSEEELNALLAMPDWWQARLAGAHSIPRELRAELRCRLDPAEAAKTTLPVLMLIGGDSPASVRGDCEALAAALPAAYVEILEGQRHIAHRLSPEVFAEHVVTFLYGRPGPYQRPKNTSNVG